MRFKKFSIAAAAAVSLLGTAAAQAQEQDVRVTIPAAGGLSVVVRNFDWLDTGSGLAIGAGPLGAQPPGTFDFLYQAGLWRFTNSSGNPLTPPTGLNGSFGEPMFSFGTYEITVAARINEVLAPGSTGSNFMYNAVGGTIAIFYDDAFHGGTPFNVLAGTGFDDGMKVAQFTIRANAGESIFSVTNPDPLNGAGFGSSTYFFDVTGPDDFVDTAFIEGVTTIGLNLSFLSSQTYPAGTSDTVAFHADAPINTPDIYPTYALTGTSDLLLKVQGSSAFGAVPEPGTVFLLGGGLLGLGFAGRRAVRSAASA